MDKYLKAGYSRIDGIGLQIFTNDELEAIHSATMDVIYSEGIKVISKKII